jgi:hypothetical protein
MILMTILRTMISNLIGNSLPLLLMGEDNPTKTASFVRRADDPTTLYLVEQVTIDGLERLVGQPPIVVTAQPR